MLKERSSTTEAIKHHKHAIARQALLLIAIAVVGLLLQMAGHEIPVVVLDSFLFSVGLIGLLVTIFLSGKRDRWPFIGLSIIAITAGLTQLFWSSGMAVGFLVLIAILPVGNALANMLIVGRYIWLDSRDRK